MIYMCHIPSKEYYFGDGEVSFDCETHVLYYSNYATDKLVTKRGASLRNFWDLVKALNGTKRDTAKGWKKFYCERQL